MIALRVNRNVLLSIAAVVLAGVACYLKASAAERLVVLPSLAVAGIVVAFFAVLWTRDGKPPVFDIGAVCMAATAVYALVPFLGYLLSGMAYSPLSARQLYELAPGPSQFAGLAWRYVVYTAGFAAVYLAARGRATLGTGDFDLPDAPTTGAVVGLYILLWGLFWGLELAYGVNFDEVYDPALLEAAMGAYLALPLAARQLLQNLYGILFVFKLGIILILFSRWRQRICRLALLGWLSLSSAWSLVHMGQRTTLVITLLAAALLYHRLVKPLKASLLLTAGIAALLIFNVLGFVRGARDVAGGLDALQTLRSSDVSVYTIATEFQTLFGGTYDLYQMKRSGALGAVPWQAYVNDLVVLVPQQLLWFPKLDIQEWYVAHSENPGYFMFGPVAQSVIGFDWIELLLRGGVLAFIFARIHRWYAARQGGYWATLFYLFLAVWSYYTIRANTFGFVYAVVYRFLPALALAYGVRRVLAGFRKAPLSAAP